jgi:hypothetical protein
MSTLIHRSIWLSRLVLAGATLLLIRIAFEYITDPIGAVTPHAITLGSPAAITIMRVSGGVFLGIAVVLAACALSERRLLAGLGFLATIAVTILAIRLVGLALDGPAPFTLKVLKPEVALVVLSTVAFFLERRRTQEPEVSDSSNLADRGAVHLRSDHG